MANKGITTKLEVEYNDNWIRENPVLFAFSFLDFKQEVAEKGLTLVGASAYPGAGYTTFVAEAEK